MKLGLFSNVLVMTLGCSSATLAADGGSRDAGMDGNRVPDAGRDGGPAAPGCPPCDDGDPCTLDYCDEGRCVFDPAIEGYSCVADFQCFGCGPCNSFGFCARACTRSAIDTGGCPRGRTCQLNGWGCYRGCLEHAECRVYAVDLDGDGRWDHDESLSDDRSNAWCDRATLRCRHPAPSDNPDVHAGAPCERDSDCEADGVCWQGFGGFPGGYCTKLGCLVPGLECAPGGRCQDLASGLVEGMDYCLAPCEVGAELGTAELILGAGGHNPGCRAGYTCMWSREAGSRTGSCWPGNYNAVTESNVGQACMIDADCYSPFGQGFCMSGMCGLRDCGAPGIPADICGTADCVSHPDYPQTTGCSVRCATPSDCVTGTACSELSPGSTYCSPTCGADAECQAGYACRRMGRSRVCQPM